MTIERIFHCDWRECSGQIRTMLPRPATAFITVEAQWPGRQEVLHFCSWDCVLRHAGEIPPVEVIEG